MRSPILPGTAADCFVAFNRSLALSIDDAPCFASPLLNFVVDFDLELLPTAYST